MVMKPWFFDISKEQLNTFQTCYNGFWENGSVDTDETVIAQI